MKEDLMLVFGEFVQRSHYSAGQVAALSGIPGRTIINWLSGRVRKPHQWRGLLQVAQVLHLSEPELSRLLQSAGHPPLPTLRQELTNPADHLLLAPWPENRLAPFQAIPDLPYFVGREAVLTELQATLRQGRTVTICSLYGMGGIGKTALAAHLAYQLRPTFPDGVLWARLDTTDTMTILGTFAAAYGQDVSEFRDMERRAAAVRTLLADKHALIILDNAQNSAQVRPLLPPTTGKPAVIITTRHDLAITDETTRFLISTFDPEQGESLAVFRHFLGERTLRRWHTELQAIADRLGHLPLAIAIAAGRLLTHRDVPGYLAELQVAEQQLSALVREDRSVRLTFDLSYLVLPPTVQGFFVALGAFGGRDFDAAAATAVTATPLPQTERYLATLQQFSLLQRGRGSRYSLHPLLRQYAQEKQIGLHALQHMTAYYVQLLANAAPDTIELEFDNVIYALDTAQQKNWPDHYLPGVHRLFPFWETRGMYVSAVPYLEQAVQMAEVVGSDIFLSEHLYTLGKSRWNMGQFAAAESHFQQGLALAETLNHPRLQSDHLGSLGIIAAYNRGEYALAEQLFHRALPLAQQANHWPRVSLLLSSLANSAYEQGDWDSARTYWQKGLDLAEETHQYNPSTARLLANLGVVTLGQGQFTASHDYSHRALALARQLHHAELTCTTLTTLSWLAHQQKQYALGFTYLEEAMPLARQMAHPEALTQVLCRLSMLAIATGAYDQAKQALDEAEQLVQEVNIHWMAVDVILQRGEMAFAQADFAAAFNLFTEAKNKATEMKAPEPLAFAQYFLAQILQRFGQLTEALAEAEASLAIFAPLHHVKAPALQTLIATLQDDKI
ncbi:MAG: tetratricopeptide repeat protein [Chloroflexi bacterium]|nr:tetratricopeptide repeat protein [Chloroflexota bacterium]